MTVSLEEKLSRIMHVLQICFDRNKKSLEFIENADIDSFNSMQYKQHMAFQNFKSLDRKLFDEGIDFLSDQNASELFQSIQKQNTQIKEKVEKLYTERRSTLVKTNVHLNALKGYVKQRPHHSFIKQV